MAMEELIKQSRDVIKILEAYNQGVETLTLKQFGRVLSLASNITTEIDLAIDSTGRSQDTLLTLRNRIESAMGKTDMGKTDGIQYNQSENQFGMFGGSSLSVREGVHVDDFDFPRNDS